MRDSLRAETVMITGADQTPVEAYFATPLAGPPRGGVVVIHHLPGYDAATKEIVRRFAALGFDAVCPNLYWREAPGASSDDAAAAVRSTGGVPDDRLVGDAAGAAAFLRARPHANGRAGVIGFCSGGRQSVLVASRLELEAAVDCYGAFVTRQPPESFPLSVSRLVDLLPQLSCPLLGLFGADDQNPSPAETAELARVLDAHGKDFTAHTYDGAGHAFFAVDRPSYRPDAAVDGWARIEAFFGRLLGAAEQPGVLDPTALDQPEA